MSNAELPRLTVKVQFPGGKVRELEADYEQELPFDRGTKFRPLRWRLVPHSMPGWEFYETIDRCWFAHEAPLPALPPPRIVRLTCAQCGWEQVVEEPRGGTGLMSPHGVCVEEFPGKIEYL